MKVREFRGRGTPGDGSEHPRNFVGVGGAVCSRDLRVLIGENLDFRDLRELLVHLKEEIECRIVVLLHWGWAKAV